MASICVNKPNNFIIQLFKRIIMYRLKAAGNFFLVWTFTYIFDLVKNIIK